MFDRLSSLYKTAGEKQILLLLVAVAFVLRLYAVLAAQGIAIDSAAYGFMARDFLEGNIRKGLSTPFHPFYPLLISLLSFDSAHVEMAGRFISLLFGTLTLIPLYYFIKKTWGEKEAMLTGLFYSFHPYLVAYSGMMLSEATYWGLLTLSIFLFWMGLAKGRVFLTISSGFLLGFAYLTRPEGIGYLFVFVIWVAIHGGIRKGWIKKIVMILGLVCSVFVLAGPYMVLIHRETGRWLISKKALEAQTPYVTWIEEEQDPQNSSKFEKGQTEPGETEIALRNKPNSGTSQALTVLQNVIRYLPSTTYYYLRAYHFTLWPFFFFGLVRRRKRETRAEVFLTSLVAFHLISLATFISSTIRFSVPVVAITLVWAGAGVLELNRFLREKRIQEPAGWVTLLILLVLIIQLPETLRPERRHRAHQKEIGLWLKHHTQEGAVIMSNSPQEAFYANRKFISLPHDSPGYGIPIRSYREVLAFAKKKNVAYIVVNNNTKEFNRAFVEAIRPEDLREFYRYVDEEGHVTLVYQVVY
jgi:4-amino-4-deoxy-L-arabinose transferase-like glycosyltransferase